MPGGFGDTNCSLPCYPGQLLRDMEVSGNICPDGSRGWHPGENWQCFQRVVFKTHLVHKTTSSVPGTRRAAFVCFGPSLGRGLASLALPFAPSGQVQRQPNSGKRLRPSVPLATVFCRPSPCRESGSKGHCPEFYCASSVLTTLCPLHRPRGMDL